MRAEADLRDDKMGAKIRDAKLRKIPNRKWHGGLEGHPSGAGPPDGFRSSRGQASPARLSASRSPAHESRPLTNGPGCRARTGRRAVMGFWNRWADAMRRA